MFQIWKHWYTLWNGFRKIKTTLTVQPLCLSQSTSVYFFGTNFMEPLTQCVCNQRTQTLATAAHSLVLSPSSHCAIPSGPQRSTHKPTNRTSRAVHPSAILRSVTLASHDILSHRQPHSSSVSSCEGAWDPATGGGHFKGRPAHSCSLSLQQPAPVCNHY